MMTCGRCRGAGWREGLRWVMRDLTDDRIRAHLGAYFQVPVPAERDRVSSFDYCFNHFQAFRERGEAARLAAPEVLELSCLHLGFYLASWGMMRGSSELLQRSLRHLVPVLEVIAATPDDLWTLDVPDYTPEAGARLLALEEQIRRALGGTREATQTLSTKVMLGVFGNVPAFDTNFCAGSGLRVLSARAVSDLRDFHTRHAGALAQPVYTRDFLTGAFTGRRYPQAKLLDMVFFLEGLG